MGVQSVWARSLYGRAVEGRANGMGTQLVWARNWYGHAIGMGMQLVWACNWYGHANGMGMQLVWACNLYGTQLAGMQLAQTRTEHWRQLTQIDAIYASFTKIGAILCDIGAN
jgi:hypothetical protein